MTSDAANIPLRSAYRVPVERLALDRSNPRLVTMEGPPDDVRIISQLYRAGELGELLQSIAANGYLDIEPLIVLESDNQLIVLEGNRRLAAIRLFREPCLVSKLAQRERLRIKLPTISAKHRKTLEEVSVYRVETRNEANSYIGFKHINGAAKWDSYAKARFAASWYRNEKITLEEVALRIGDRHDTVKRMVNAIYVLEQADHQDIFHLSDRNVARINFSHLYTALSRSEFMIFLGLGSSWSKYNPQSNPVPKDKLLELKEVLVWLYGLKSEERKPIIVSQNPDIKNLGEVLLSHEGLETLRATGSLDEALADTKSADSKLAESLYSARRYIREASKNLRGFSGSHVGLLAVAEEVSSTSQAVYDWMKKKI